MKTTKLIRCALFVAVLAAFSLVGCEKTDIYSIDAPADLQNRIDSIADANASIDTGDTTYINIATAIVGAEDASAAWWTAFSDYFTVPTNKLLHLEFVNHSSGVNNWNNWNLAIANEVADRDGDAYKQYFVLRSDAYGWGGEMVDDGYVFDLGVLTHNYTDIDGDDDIWNDFRTTMQGATVSIDVDHSATGNVYITATAVGTNGVELIQTYQQAVSATADINAFLICDGSYFEMNEAYLIPSKVTVVEDVDPVSISIAGAPAFVELGNENFWGDAVATVSFADGSSAEVDSVDMVFTVSPEMSTLGEKTVIVSYNKTKQGAYSPAVSTFYTLEVTNPVTSLEVTTLPEITEYYYFGTDAILFDPTGIEVTATYSDGTTAVMDNSTLVFGTIPAGEGAQTVDVSYEGATSTVTTTCPVTLMQGIAQVGANDFSTPWATYSGEYTVETTTTITMYCYSDNAANWHSPCVVVGQAGNLNVDVAQADGAAAVVRMDNYGWGSGYNGDNATSDWNWDVFTSSINGSQIVVTVTNNGDNTANIRYDVTYANGDTHFQNYAGVAVDSSNLSCAIALEGAYVVMVSNQ